MTIVYPNDTHLNKNLTWNEMRCNCGASMSEPQELNAIDYAKVWQLVRDGYGHKMIINCGHRCPACNRRVGGKPKSWHLQARATDNHGEHNTVEEAIAIAKVAILIPQVKGLCVYDTAHGSFVHIDNRPGPRWLSVNGEDWNEGRLRRWIAAGRVTA